MKLAAKLLLTFFLAVILITTLFSYLLIKQDQRRFHREHERTVRELAAAIEPQLEALWKAQGREGLHQALTPNVRALQTYRVRWVWLDSETQDAATPASRPHLLMAVTRGEVISSSLPDSQGQTQLLTYCPLELESAPKGGLEIAVPMQSILQEARETWVATIVAMAAMALVGSGMVMIVGLRIVGQPLQALIDKTRRVGEGDFGTPVSVRGNDELQQLGMALNEMCQRLQRQQEALRAVTASRVTAMEQLRHADRLKTVGRLAAGMAHEMGTPLNVISGRAGMIAAGSLASEDVRSSAEAIKSEADRIAGIIRQVLNFARPSRPHRRLEDVRPVVERTVSLLTPLAEKRNVQCALEPPAGDLLPGKVTAFVDPDQLQQVLTNVIMNAIQSTPEGGRVTISCALAQDAVPAPSGAAERTDPSASTLPVPGEPEPAMPPAAAPPREMVAIAVRDTGAGISAQDLAHLFEPFFTTKDVGEGTGLGLSIAYGIVQEHGGWIDVASEPGAGSCFTIYLPRE